MKTIPKETDWQVLHRELERSRTESTVLQERHKSAAEKLWDLVPSSGSCLPPAEPNAIDLLFGNDGPDTPRK